MVSTHVASGLGAEEKTRILDEVLGSETFARSERLKVLLRFLCEAEIDGREGELNEYSIGTIALGRPKEFAPLEDSSVRSRVFELRQKLEKYYANEAPGAPVRIELRKGSYVPRFYPAHMEPEPEAERLEVLTPALAAPLAVPPAPAPGRWPVWALAGAFLAGALATFGAVAVWSSTAKPGARLPATRLENAGVPSRWTPELEALWQPFVQDATPLLVAFENRFFVEMGPLVVRDWHINSLAHVEESEPLARVQKLFGVHQLYGTWNYTDVGTPQAVFYLSRLLGSRVPSITVKSSLLVSADDLRTSNMILAGKPWTDPEISRLLEKGALLDDNGKIRNLRPKPGELSEYKDENNFPDPDRWSVKYSVISLLPGPSRGRKVMTLLGSGSEQPSALAYYMTNADSVRDLYRHLRSDSPTVPDYYQVLVRAEFKSKALVRVEYVTHRAFKAIL